MLGKFKDIFSSKENIEIRPVLAGDTIRIAFFINGQELLWDNLSDKEQKRYSRLIDKKYGRDPVPLEKFSPRVGAKATHEEYHGEGIDFLIDALKDWEECPESHPALEEWFQDGCPEIAKKKSKEKLDFDVYYPIFEEARELKSSDIVAAVEKYVFILNNYKPIGSLYYTEPAELFCRLCRYDEAVFCIGLARENIRSIHENEQSLVLYDLPKIIEDIELQRKIFIEVQPLVKNDPGIVQTEIYKNIDFNPDKIRMVIYNMANSGFLKREKHKTSYKLYPTSKETAKDFVIGF
ncbi:hypothetical protein [Clostridium formicaceticum]|uniref:Uncharacterized protein n=1 Tax=Clostridium formicaceticum TaxID=1497 RepID=A0AAC9WGB8_9CLOT|nr:hypothetical protein [Clostridium formicaceticum]AOY77232.1 hypothetical protein BJL90_16070 [Clostridium formicaceticum]ARE87763.1 hypothetical protein CLFO_21630 [Clostridium formicaceticum]